jgi:hypothetical protein
VEYRQFVLGFILFCICYFFGFFILGFFLIAFSLCVFEDPEDFAEDDEVFTEAPFEDPGYDYDVYTFQKRRQNLANFDASSNEIGLLSYSFNLKSNVFCTYESVNTGVFSPVVFKRYSFGLKKSVK